MKTIYKYELNISIDLPFQEQIIEMPRDAMTLHVGVQDGTPHVWALVDKKRPMQEITFITVFTGRENPDLEYYNYVGTFMLFQGRRVYHVFRK